MNFSEQEQAIWNVAFAIAFRHAGDHYENDPPDKALAKDARRTADRTVLAFRVNRDQDPDFGRVTR